MERHWPTRGYSCPTPIACSAAARRSTTSPEAGSRRWTRSGAWWTQDVASEEAELPRTHEVRVRDAHRLVPSRYSDESVLTRLTTDLADLQALFELDGATNARLIAETRGVVGIGPDELLAGVPYAHVVNAAFCHPHPEGGRFNGPERGAWYAGLAVETCQAEVAFHKLVQLAEI